MAPRRSAALASEPAVALSKLEPQMMLMLIRRKSYLRCRAEPAFVVPFLDRTRSAIKTRNARFDPTENMAVDTIQTHAKLVQESLNEAMATDLAAYQKKITKNTQH